MPGDYEFVLFQTGYQTTNEPSLKFSVIKAGEDLVALKTDRNAYKPAQAIEVQLTLHTSLSDQAWLGIFSASTPHEDPKGYLAYEYIRTGNEEPYRFMAPEKPGDYELRVFDDTFGNEITHTSFRVGLFSGKNLSLTTDRSSYDPQETVKLHVVADKEFPRHAWVGMYTDDTRNDGDALEDYLEFRYLDKRTETDLLFQAPAEKGKYLFKMVSSQNGTLVATTSFTIKRSMDSALLKQELDKSERVALYGIYFDLDKSDIKAASYHTLSAIGDLLNQHPQLSLVIEGHTDNQGDAGYNRKLSERRAQAVRKHLINTYAVSAERLATRGYGEEQPVSNNDTEAGRVLNRRVEIVKASSEIE